MRQGAVGGVLQYALCHRWLESVELYGSYASCTGRHLKSHPCCVQKTNLLDQVCRNISGGKDSFAGLGITMQPWRRATFSLAADYDYVTYKRKLASNNLTTSGFGGTAKFNKLQAAENSVKERITMGNARSPVEVYIFTDWGCPACKS